MRIRSVVRREEIQIGQLCARSARAIEGRVNQVDPENVADVVELGFRLAGDDQARAQLMASVPVRNPRAIWWEANGSQEHGGKKIAVVQSRSDTWILTAVQYAVFRLVDGNRSVAELIDQVSQDLNIDNQVVLVQIAEMLGREHSTLPLQAAFAIQGSATKETVTSI